MQPECPKEGRKVEAWGRACRRLPGLAGGATRVLHRPCRRKQRRRLRMLPGAAFLSSRKAPSLEGPACMYSHRMSSPWVRWGL